MRDVYLKNPQMGDAGSVGQKLIEIGNNIEKLRVEAQKFEVSIHVLHSVGKCHNR